MEWLWVYIIVWGVAITVANFDLCLELKKRGVHSYYHWANLLPYHKRRT